MTVDAVSQTRVDVAFSHVALLVSDIEASVRWYRRLFGWTEHFVSSMSSELGDLNGFTGKPGTVAMGDVGGVRVEFVQMDTDDTLVAPTAKDRHGLFLLTVRVDDLVALRQRFERFGTTVVREGRIGHTTTLVVEDPDGQEVAVVWVEP
jgi:catechol 2,3-dioxygenase-like lactoylglutathione lyase family enzyme